MNLIWEDEKAILGLPPMLTQATRRIEYHCVTFGKTFNFSHFQSLCLYNKGTKSCFTVLYNGVREYKWSD